MIYFCIPVHNRVEFTLNCLESIYKYCSVPFLVVICDDGSTDETLRKVKLNHSDVIVLEGDGNLWWTGGINRCISYILELDNIDFDRDYIFTFNNDALLLPETIPNLLQHLKKYPYAIIGCVNLFANSSNKIEPSAIVKRRKWGLNRLSQKHQWGELFYTSENLLEVEALSGKGVIIPVSVFKNHGLYNQEMLPHYHADTEFTIRMRRHNIRVFLSLTACIKSFQHETGLSFAGDTPSFIMFLRSFFSIKSTRHLRSIYNWNKLIYGNGFILWFFLQLVGIFKGYIIRRVRNR
ncbi:MAG: glycosyltransferase family 2 protein [Bacteroidia bacterium]|nr:glycosyltransferase family 2 protein [Bacteroidia bacterium]